MEEQLKRIKVKFQLLKQSDKQLTVFGAAKHRYEMNNPITIEYIKNFERNYQIKLPEELVAFYTNIGNGGAGPFYGLEPIDDTIYYDLEYKKNNDLLNPSKPFSHKEAWNLKFESTVSYEENEEEYYEEREAFEIRYYSPELMNGVLAICNYGCAVSLNIVVNGDEYGFIWADDRASDGGIRPSYELGNKEKITFLNWYELWLDKSLEEIGPIDEEITTQDETQVEQLKDSKPWWKFW